MEKQLFINTLSPDIDYSYWSKMETLTLYETIFLFLRVNPRNVDWRHFQKSIEDKSDELSSSPSILKYIEIKELIKRKFKCEAFNADEFTHLYYTNITPAEAIAWASKTDIDIPNDLSDAVEKKTERALTFAKMEEELKSLKTNVQGIRLTEIMAAGCLTDGLQTLLLASQTHWVPWGKDKNLKPPINKTIELWLMERGIKKAPAETLASFIRPADVPNGRRRGK